MDHYRQVTGAPAATTTSIGYRSFDTPYYRPVPMSYNRAGQWDYYNQNSYDTNVGDSFYNNQTHYQTCWPSGNSASDPYLRQSVASASAYPNLRSASYYENINDYSSNNNYYRRDKTSTATNYPYNTYSTANNETQSNHYGANKNYNWPDYYNQPTSRWKSADNLGYENYTEQPQRQQSNYTYNDYIQANTNRQYYQSDPTRPLSTSPYHQPHYNITSNYNHLAYPQRPSSLPNSYSFYNYPPAAVTTAIASTDPQANMYGQTTTSGYYSTMANDSYGQASSYGCAQQQQQSASIQLSQYGQQTNPSHYGTITGQPGTVLTTAQHNHPPYYQQQTDGAYGGQQQTSMYDQTSGYANGYPPNLGQTTATSGQYGNQSSYGQTVSNYSTSYDQSAYQTSQTASVTPKSTYPVSNNLTLSKSLASAAPPMTAATNVKSPYGMSGPYGNDAGNTYLDYYRKLYYPYDPITGEYMKDEPAGDTAAATTMLPNVMPPGMTDQSQTMGQGGVGIGGGGANGGIGNRYGGVGSALYDNRNMMSSGNQNFYPPMNNDDSLLLCCDFLIPRPSINCLIITLFAMLVLIIIFTVVKFTIIYPSDSINPETIALVDQIIVLLLFGALLALIWIFGIYFTSRRTRHQISNLLSCVSNPIVNYDSTLVTDYDGYGHHQHTHSHQQTGRSLATRYNTSNSNYGGSSSNYRYANNFV